MAENFKISATDDGIRFNIKVIPSSSKCEVAGVVEGELKIRLDVPPVDGKANEKCVKFLAKMLGVPKSAITILHGEKSRSKTIFVKGEPEKIKQVLLNSIAIQYRKTEINF